MLIATVVTRDFPREYLRMTPTRRNSSFVDNGIDRLRVEQVMFKGLLYRYIEPG